MNESGFTSGINQGVRKHKPALVWKISDRFVAGVPDAYYSGDKADLWLEFKYVKQLPKRGNVTPALTAAQQGWLRTQNALGRMVGVVIGSPEGAIIYPDLTWESPVPTRLHRVHNKKGVISWIVSKINHTTILSLVTPPP